MTLGFPPWRREALRTTLWVVPSGLLVAAVALFAVLGPSYPRMLNRAYDKIRQAGAEMPAVPIRLLESLGKVLAYTRDEAQRTALLRHAQMLWRASQAGIREQEDLLEVRRRYDLLTTALTSSRNAPRRAGPVQAGSLGARHPSLV